MATHTDFSRIFIDRPILATVLSALILVSGLMAIPNLPISEYPDVVPPSVQVTATYPGANPRTIADTVAGPLEEAVNGVENMIYMKSTASSDGQMSLTVTFKGGTNIDLAAVQGSAQRFGRSRSQATSPSPATDTKVVSVGQITLRTVSVCEANSTGSTNCPRCRLHRRTR